MAQQSATVDMLLTEVSNRVSPEGYIADQLLTPLPVRQWSGSIAQYNKDNLVVHNTLASPDAPFNRINISIEKTVGYQLGLHGLETFVTRADKDNRILPFDAVEDRMLLLSDAMKIAEEVQIAAVFQDPTVITNNVTLAGASQYDHSTGGDPINDFKEAREAVRRKIGRYPNMCIVPAAVWSVLESNPKILANFRSPSDALASAPMIKQVLGGGMAAVVSEGVAPKMTFLVPTVIKNNSNTGEEADVQDIWGDAIIFYYRAPRPGLRQVTFGYQIGLTDGRGGTSANPTIYRDPVTSPPKSELIQAERIYQQFIADKDAAFAIYNTLAAQ